MSILKNLVVVKSNRLIRARQALSLAEDRILQLAIVCARESGTGLDARYPLEISALQYAAEFNVSESTAYETLQSAVKTLFHRQFTIIASDGDPVVSHWIQDIKYPKKSGKIEIALSRILIEQIIRIDGCTEYFTQYRMQQTAPMTSVYARRLYELLIQYKNIRPPAKIPTFFIEDFREQIGVEPQQYKRMSDFKKVILNVAIAQIEKHSDIIEVTYTQKKMGLKIVGFDFKIKMKPSEKSAKSDENSTGDQFAVMTDRQVYFCASMLSKLAVVQNKAAAGQTNKQFIEHISASLRDREKQKEYQQYFAEIGFKPKY